MSSKKYGPSLIIDLAPPQFQLLLLFIIHALALRAVFLCEFPFGEELIKSVIYLCLLVSGIRSIYQYHCARVDGVRAKLIVRSDGEFLLQNVDMKPLPVRIGLVGSRGRYMMVLALESEQGSSEHIITPGMIGQRLYRQLRVRLAIQPKIEEPIAPTYWQQIFQRG